MTFVLSRKSMSVLFGQLVSRLKSASSPSEREGKLSLVFLVLQRDTGAPFPIGWHFNITS